MNRFDHDLLDQIANYMVAPEGFPERLHRLAFPVALGDTLTASVILWTEDTVEEVSKRKPNIQYPQYLILPSDTDIVALTESMERLARRALEAFTGY